MHKYASLNCRIIPSEHTLLSAISNAVLYGKGIFTTVAVYNSKPFLWEKHWRRLNQAADKLRINLSSVTEETLKTSLFDLAEANKMLNGRARVTIFDETPSRIWQIDTNQRTSFLIQTADFRAADGAIRLNVSPFPVNLKSPLAGIKTCNYLENILALDNAEASGFDESVRLNQRDEVVSSAMANIFWVKGGEIFTPALTTGCLPGTTREFITENLAVNEVNVGLNVLNAADEVFITSAGVGILAVKNINERCFSEIPRVTTNIQKIFKSFSDTM